MSQALSLNNPIESIFNKYTNKKVGRYAVLVAAGIILLTLASKIAIPLVPVPMTLQSLAVLFIGMIYGSRLGTATVSIYAALGLLGMPLLAVAPGLSSLGYLIGFIPAAYVAGILIERGWGRSILTSALAALFGTIIIFAFGLTWLSYIVGIKSAIMFGLMPFIFVEIAKICALALIVPRFWKR